MGEIPGLNPPAIDAQSIQALPVEHLIPATGYELYTFDSAKAEAEANGIFVATNTSVQNDMKFGAGALEANVVTIGANAGSLDPMNLRFYGSLLIFAAGCIMYLGLTVRRHP